MAPSLLPYLPTLFALFLLCGNPSPASAAQICLASLRAEPKETPSKELVQQWLRVYVEHQNSLRQKQNLPPIDPQALEDGLQNIPPQVDSEHPIVIKGARAIYELKKDWLIPRPNTDDVNSLNYVYQFDGPKLKKAIPAAIYFLEQTPGAEISLRRGMSWREYRLWEANDLRTLRRISRSLQNNWGFDQPRVHFSINTSRGIGDVEMTFKVPKKRALAWARSGLASVGCWRWHLNDRRFELVVLNDAWEELVKYQF